MSLPRPSGITWALTRRHLDQVALVAAAAGVLAGLVLLAGVMGRQVRTPPLAVLRLALDATLVILPWLTTPILALATISYAIRTSRDGHFRRLAILGYEPWRFHLLVLGNCLLIGLGAWWMASFGAPHLMDRMRQQAAAIHPDPDLLAAALTEDPRALGWGTIHILGDSDTEGLHQVVMVKQDSTALRLLHAERLTLSDGQHGELHQVQIAAVYRTSTAPRVETRLGAELVQFQLPEDASSTVVPPLRLLDDHALAGLPEHIIAAVSKGFPLSEAERRCSQAAQPLRLVRAQFLVLPALAVLTALLLLTAVPRPSRALPWAVVTGVVLVPASHLAIEQAVVAGRLLHPMLALLPTWIGLTGVAAVWTRIRC